MPHVVHDGIRVHYEVEGAGPPLVLQHWSLATLDDWVECGFVDALRSDHRVILVDARGHGGSDRPHDVEAYALARRVGDLVAVLDDLGVDRAHYFGYSMGGWIGFGILKHAPERFRSLVIGGQHPFEQSMAPLREFIRIGIDRGVDAFIAAWENGFGPLPEAKKARLRRADLEALHAVAHDRESLEEAASTATIPSLVIVGEVDTVFARAKAGAALMRNAEFVALPGLDHGGCLDRADLVVPHVRRFVKSVEEERA